MICSLYKITTDEDGESRIVLKVPSSDLAVAVSLLTMLGKVLDATFKEKATP